jgi:hypothetical protein
VHGMPKGPMIDDNLPRTILSELTRLGIASGGVASGIASRKKAEAIDEGEGPRNRSGDDQGAWSRERRRSARMTKIA